MARGVVREGRVARGARDVRGGSVGRFRGGERGSIGATRTGKKPAANVERAGRTEL